MWKKLLLSLWLAGMLWLGTLGIANADVQEVDMTNGWNWLTATVWSDQWIDTIGTENDQNWSLIQIIKNFINRVLWIMALIVLVIVLVWWFQMVTASGNEEKYKKWFTILKHAGIWLVVIWLAWFVVTIIFWLLRNTTWNGSWTTTNW